LLPSVLPAVLTVTGTQEPWLELTTGEILTELNNGGPGAAEVATRLTDMLLVRAIRSYLNRKMDTAQSGWLAAARDRHIAGVLDIPPRDPQRTWTVDAMARSVALSRSAFAARFKELLGEPPLRYLTRLRVDGASLQLRSSDDKLRTIASAAGYCSVA